MKPGQLMLEKTAELFGALGHPHRVAIVQVLRGGERCVCDIAAELGLQQPNTSQHLGMLRRAGLVAFRKDGLRTIYQLTSPRVLEMLDVAREILRQQSQLDREAWEDSGGTLAQPADTAVRGWKTHG